MTRTLAELVLLGALLGAAWLIGVGNSRLAPQVPTRPPAAVYGGSPVDAGLPERAAALRTYLASPPPQIPVRRNPFGFRDPTPASAGGSSRVPVAADPAASRPDMELSGIAEDTGNGHPLRTAVIAVAGQLVFVREGDRVLSRYVVVQITADAVHLKDDEGGAVFSLTLK